MLRNVHCCLAALAAVAWISGAAGAAVLGQVDDFEDLTTQDWTGAPGFFVNQADGGPGGVGDAYLEVTGTGTSGMGSRVASFNETQWQGDYLAAGINAISVDMANFGTNDFEMRVQIFGFNNSIFTSTLTTLVPADGEWRTFVFELSDASLTRTTGLGTANDMLAGVGRLMFRHQTGPPAGPSLGTPIEGVLGIDNITAVAVPAPGVLALLLIGGIGSDRRRRP